MFRKSSRAGSIPGDTPTISATCLALALLLLAALAAPTASEAAVRDEIIVHRAPGLTAAERSDLRSDAGVTLKRLLPSLDRVELVRAPVGERDEALAALRQDPDVLWAEPDHVASIATATPPDPDWGSLWGLHNAGDLGTLDADVDADEAWARSRGAGVTVAVADTGVDAHADLSGQLVAGRNFRPNDVTSTTDPTPLGPNNTRDVYSHGTHVAGTIAAVSNSRDVVGVAPEAKVMPLRVLGDNGSGSMSDVASSFAYAGDQGIRIVNASLGSTSATLAEEQAIRDHPNTLYVVAAGNDGRTLSPDVYNFFPCAYAQPNVICVGATTNLDEPANYSNRSPVSVDLFAPGTSVLSLMSGGGLANKSGTSMATPHVAGAAALLLSEHPGWSAAQVKAALLDSGDPIPALATISVTGRRLNAARALGLTVDPDGRAPLSPQGLVSAVEGQAIQLDWDEGTEPDLAGYEVWVQEGADPWTLDPERGGEPGDRRRPPSGALVLAEGLGPRPPRQLEPELRRCVCVPTGRTRGTRATRGTPGHAGATRRHAGTTRHAAAASTRDAAARADLPLAADACRGAIAAEHAAAADCSDATHTAGPIGSDHERAPAAARRRPATAGQAKPAGRCQRALHTRRSGAGDRQLEPPGEGALPARRDARGEPWRRAAAAGACSRPPPAHAPR